MEEGGWGWGRLLWRGQSLHCLSFQPLTRPHPCPRPAGCPFQSLPPPPPPGSPLSGLASGGGGQEPALLSLWHSEAPATGWGGPGGRPPSPSASCSLSAVGVRSDGDGRVFSMGPGAQQCSGVRCSHFEADGFVVSTVVRVTEGGAQPAGRRSACTLWAVCGTGRRTCPRERQGLRGGNQRLFRPSPRPPALSDGPSLMLASDQRAQETQSGRPPSQGLAGVGGGLSWTLSYTLSRLSFRGSAFWSCSPCCM